MFWVLLSGFQINRVSAGNQDRSRVGERSFWRFPPSTIFRKQLAGGARSWRQPSDHLFHLSADVTIARSNGYTGHPFPATSNFYRDETMFTEGPNYAALLTPQNPREDQVTFWCKMLRPDRWRIDQDLAEEVCGNDIEPLRKLLLQNITRSDLNVPNAVCTCIPFRGYASNRIVIDRKHVSRPEITACYCQNAAACAGIEHRPARLKGMGDALE